MSMIVEILAIALILSAVWIGGKEYAALQQARARRMRLEREVELTNPQDPDNDTDKP